MWFSLDRPVGKAVCEIVQTSPYCSFIFNNRLWNWINPHDPGFSGGLGSALHWCNVWTVAAREIKRHPREMREGYCVVNNQGVSRHRGGARTYRGLALGPPGRPRPPCSPCPGDKRPHPQSAALYTWLTGRTMTAATPQGSRSSPAAVEYIENLDSVKI